MEDGGTRVKVTRTGTSDGTRPTNKSETHTFGKIGSEVFVQLVKVGFGDYDGVQRGIISTLVWRTPRLERAVLIA